MIVKHLENSHMWVSHNSLIFTHLRIKVAHRIKIYYNNSMTDDKPTNNNSSNQRLASKLAYGGGIMWIVAFILIAASKDARLEINESRLVLGGLGIIMGMVIAGVGGCLGVVSKNVRAVIFGFAPVVVFGILFIMTSLVR